MKSRIQDAAITVVAAALTMSAAADVTGFVDNPTGNSADMTNWVSGLGAYTMNWGVNFESHPDGDLVARFYPGVTLSGTNVQIAHGSGSADGSSARPLSTGEGTLGTRRGYALNQSPPRGWSLTVSFDAPVAAAGFMTADYFNALGDNPLTIEAFDGPDGTGASLGSFTSVSLNFETNSLYFMGIGDDQVRIRSISIRADSVLYGDTQYVDGVAFAAAPAAPPPPPPCVGDLNGDGKVDGADLGLLLSHWGFCL